MQIDNPVIIGTLTGTASIAVTSSFSVFSNQSTTSSYSNTTRQLGSGSFVPYDIVTNYQGGAQDIPINNYTFISGSTLTFTVPSGFSANRIVFQIHHWGDASASTLAMGSLRYRIRFTSGGLASLEGANIASWSLPIANQTTRFNSTGMAMVTTTVAPGTYTAIYEAIREGESGTITLLRGWVTNAQATVLVKL